MAPLGHHNYGFVVIIWPVPSHVIAFLKGSVGTNEEGIAETFSDNLTVKVKSILVSWQLIIIYYCYACDQADQLMIWYFVRIHAGIII